MKSSTNWHIRAYEGLDGLKQLEGDWRRLLAEMPGHGPQHHMEILQAYSECLCLTAGITCLALSDGQRVRAIVPLERYRFGSFGLKMEAWGTPWQLFDICPDLICPDAEAKAVVIEHVLGWIRRLPGRQPAWLLFDRIFEGSGALDCVKRHPDRAVCIDDYGAAAVFDCETTYAAFERRLSRKFNANLRAAGRRLQAMDGVRFVNITDPVELQRELKVFLAVEASGWKGSDGTRTAICFRPDQRAYYEALVRTSATGSGIEINALYVGETCIASAICLRGGSEYAVPKIGHDESHAQLSPGHLLMQWIIRRCMDDPEIRRLNMVSNAAWLSAWRPLQIGRYRVTVGISPWFGPLWAWFMKQGTFWAPRFKRALGIFRNEAPN